MESNTPVNYFFDDSYYYNNYNTYDNRNYSVGCDTLPTEIAIEIDRQIRRPELINPEIFENFDAESEKDSPASETGNPILYETPSTTDSLPSSAQSMDDMFLTLNYRTYDNRNYSVGCDTLPTEIAIEIDRQIRRPELINPEIFENFDAESEKDNPASETGNPILYETPSTTDSLPSSAQSMDDMFLTHNYRTYDNRNYSVRCDTLPADIAIEIDRQIRSPDFINPQIFENFEDETERQPNDNPASETGNPILYETPSTTTDSNPSSVRSMDDMFLTHSDVFEKLNIIETEIPASVKEFCIERSESQISSQISPLINGLVTKPAKKYTKRSKSTTPTASSSSGVRKRRSLHYCCICDKRFQDQYSVNVHIRTHTGEKPFTCSLCGKSFRQKAHLAKHNETHIKRGLSASNSGKNLIPSS